jgi:enoyl-[acyl-carrier protein] reductase III
MAKEVLILGASSGFGLATAKYHAQKGYNIYGVHFDRKKYVKETLNPAIEEMQSHGVDVKYFNMNAADEEKMDACIEELQKSATNFELVMHSLAFGTLKPMFTGDDVLSSKNISMTLNVMGYSLVPWLQKLLTANLVGKGTHVVGMTSEGNQVIWEGYGAVSQAKLVLELTLKQAAVELGRLGIRANAIQAGVTPTPAQQKIPGATEMVENAAKINPSGTLTSPEKVAKAIWLLSQPEAEFISGNIIRVDGGEALVKS